MKYILGSTSPRRKELLSRLDIDFEIITKETDETLTSNNGKIEAKRLALKKGLAIACDLKESIIITADTVVWFNKTILGKPNSEAEAIEMLQLLSGKKHKVTTGFSIVKVDNDSNIEDIIVDSTTTIVTFDDLSDIDIQSYIKTEEWRGVAGAYRIQGVGENYITKIKGSYSGVMGLPVNKLKKALELI